MGCFFIAFHKCEPCNLLQKLCNTFTLKGTQLCSANNSSRINLIKMKSKLIILILFLLVVFFPTFNFAQAPDLGTASSFAVFTASGSFSNTGATRITGNSGTNTATPTGFPPGVVIGTIYQAGDAVAMQATADIATAYSDLSGVTCGTVIGTTLGNGQILNAGVYCLGGASTLDGNLILDGQGDSNALFIIKVGGALSTEALSNVILINSVSLCNVYWQINGQFDLGDSSLFRGTVIVNGAIKLLEGASLEGRVLSVGGAVSLHNNTLFFLPSAGIITGTAGVCETRTGIIYSVPAIYNTTGYVWSLPAGASITAGANTNSITVDFSMGASPGNITVYGTNPCGNGIISSDYILTVWPLPLTSAIYHQ